MDKAWIFLLIFLGTLAAAGAISVWIIQRKLRQVSRSMFGTDSLLEGLEQQEERIAETPRSVSSMTSIYLPQIAKDFPEFSLEEFRKKIRKQPERVPVCSGDTGAFFSGRDL